MLDHARQLASPFALSEEYADRFPRSAGLRYLSRRIGRSAACQESRSAA